MAALFVRHPIVLQNAFSELKRRAAEQPYLLIGTPGSVVVRTTSAHRFLYRDYYGPDGKKAGDYIGPERDAAAEARADAIREQIALANALIDEARLLAQRGYVRVDPRTEAVLAAVANHGLFRAGALVVGTHAFGAVLNELGVRAAPVGTEDVDIARDRRLELDQPTKSFEEMLASSRIPLHAIPQLELRSPPTSFKPPGPARFRVDLLVPADGNEVTVREVRELRAHATALPWLRYVLHDPMPSLILGKNAMVPVNVPQPERLACHKMLVSELRHATREKRAKDVEQASTLVAVLAETDPERLARAFAALPRAAKRKSHRGAKNVLARLEASPHEHAVAFMKDLLG